jgi:hypothetical protein
MKYTERARERDRGSEETGNLVRRSENKRIMIIVLGPYIFLGQD